MSLNSVGLNSKVFLERVRFILKFGISMHSVFHVSLLRKYISDSSSIVPLETFDSNSRLVSLEVKDIRKFHLL